VRSLMLCRVAGNRESAYSTAGLASAGDSVTTAD